MSDRLMCDNTMQHMAIVNEDVRMVKLLLDCGANVHERSLGSFWVPDDQKDLTNKGLRELLTHDKANNGYNETYTSDLKDLDLSCNHISNRQLTNYGGYVG